MHEIVLANRLEQLRRKQRDEAKQIQMQMLKEVNKPGAAAEQEQEISSTEVEEVHVAKKQAWDASMEPPILPGVLNEDKDLELIEPDLDRIELVKLRRHVHSQRFVSRKAKAANDDEPQTGPMTAQRKKDVISALYDAEAEQGLDEDEELFEMEAELTKQSYVWEDKYRPRKPRYFNKVMTGFEWNKYNQTHYK